MKTDDVDGGPHYDDRMRFMREAQYFLTKCGDPEMVRLAVESVLTHIGPSDDDEFMLDMEGRHLTADMVEWVGVPADATRYDAAASYEGGE